MPTNHFKFSWEHKNSTHTQFLHSSAAPLRTTRPVLGTGTSEAPTPCASQQRESHTGSSWCWNHPKTRNTAQNIPNSSCKISGSRPNFPPSALSQRLSLGRQGCLHTRLTTSPTESSSSAALPLRLLDDELLDLLDHVMLFPCWICS